MMRETVLLECRKTPPVRKEQLRYPPSPAKTKQRKEDNSANNKNEEMKTVSKTLFTMEKKTLVQKLKNKFIPPCKQRQTTF